MRRATFFALLLFCGACSDSTGPDDAAVGGTWRFSYNNMTGAFQGVTVSCNLGSADFVLTQNGRTFSGVQQGTARMTCASGGQTILDNLVGGETIVEGQVSGNALSFRLGTIPGPHNATVNGGSMTGTAQWVITSGNSSITLNGQFNAAKL